MYDRQISPDSSNMTLTRRWSSDGQSEPQLALSLLVLFGPPYLRAARLNPFEQSDIEEVALKTLVADADRTLGGVSG
jgi:hypothetical protein